jgi:hypothetical protein
METFWIDFWTLDQALHCEAHTAPSSIANKIDIPHPPARLAKHIPPIVDGRANSPTPEPSRAWLFIHLMVQGYRRGERLKD